MIVYADSSFLVSSYITDRHATVVDRFWLASPKFFLTPLHRAEWAHAVAQHVFRKFMSAADADQADREFEADCVAGLWKDVAIPEHAFEICAQLARRYCPLLGVRTLDSLHVACALELNAERFWTFDDRQAKLAKARGLKTN